MMNELGNSKWGTNLVEKILVKEKKLSDINFGKLKKALPYIKSNLSDSDNSMYFRVNLLIDKENIKTGPNNVTFKIS